MFKLLGILLISIPFLFLTTLAMAFGLFGAFLYVLYLFAASVTIGCFVGGIMLLKIAKGI